MGCRAAFAWPCPQAPTPNTFPVGPDTLGPVPLPGVRVCDLSRAGGQFGGGPAAAALLCRQMAWGCRPMRTASISCLGPLLLQVCVYFQSQADEYAGGLASAALHGGHVA